MYVSNCFFEMFFMQCRNCGIASYWCQQFNCAWSTTMVWVITKLPNSEQSYKGKVKTHKYINRHSVSTCSSELSWNHLQWTSTNQQLESTTPNHRRRPNTIKLLAPVTSNSRISVELLVTDANNLIVFGLRRWFGAVDSSCWFVDVHCRCFQLSSEEPMLTECLFIYLWVLTFPL
jgi:hypothetical protein